ncbi:AraC family transcriptional regulator [Acinetobacter sp. RF15A]|uniref:AraC family transcriptional regulator n=1 Tax=Acinetobacter lwoffii TaxID=28090 RepID=A0A9D2ZZ06_ACILW|nr:MULTISPECIES: AraC family transcriptional regulator [unclassified Acinetobacter]TSH76947.1 AraC family transcriptional regulator [Acinetobacter sp. RF15A]TSI18389.1 AraC family transcriptional regulator [Acinetobacter sp. RF15B]HJF28306.1 AraC family transcriptional regulator [Acinetobacter lwoffii]
MKDPFLLNSASIPVSYAVILLEIMAKKGIDSTDLLRKSRIPHQALLQDRITPRQWSRLVWESLQLTDHDGLGYEYGVALRLTAHGPMGFALMSCANLKQAIELVLQFFTMRLRHYQITFHENPNQSSLEITELHPVMASQAEQIFILRRFFYECIMIGAVQAAKFLTHEDYSKVGIDFDWSEPNYHAKYRQMLPTIQFNQPNNMIHFETEMLYVPIYMADPIAYQQALQQCKIEQQYFVLKISDITLQVKSKLILTPRKGYPSLEEIAESMAVSSRTLKRNLHNVGTTYSSLLDEIRLHDAKDLLTKSDMSIQQIAEYLGYEQPTNFTRAFKKWVGISPSEFRETKHSLISI